MIRRLVLLGALLSSGVAVGPLLGQRPFAQAGGGVALFRTEHGAPADPRGTETQPLAMAALGVHAGALILRVDGRAHGARLGTLLAATAGLGVTATGGSARPYLLGAVGRGKITEGDHGVVLSALAGLTTRGFFAEARVDRLTADELPPADQHLRLAPGRSPAGPLTPEVGLNPPCGSLHGRFGMFHPGASARRIR